jgi:hypothetical protein
MKTKIIIKMDRDLSDIELDVLCKEIIDTHSLTLGRHGIKTNYEILTHKGGVNVPQQSYCHVKDYKQEVK